MSSDGQERNQKATARRMREVYRDGKLGRSQDLSTWIGLAAAVVALPMVLSRGQQTAREQLAVVRDVARTPDPRSVVPVLGDALGSVLGTLAPLFALVVAVTIAVGLVQGGYRPRRFKLHLDQLNPVKGVRRLFGVQSLWMGTKTLLKTAAVALVLLLGIQSLVPVLMASGRLPLAALLQTASSGATTLLRAGVAAGILLAVLDVVVVMRRNRKQTRMTLREVKEEHKRTEGDPLVKGQIRQRQMAMSRNRMMAEIGKADVVLVNPTHVAVALRYEPGSGAPRVVAKGVGAVAERIRAVAAEHGVPLVQDVPLARALNAACELGQEIPEHLFTAVAHVLAFVMALRRRGAATGWHRVPGGSTLPPDDTTDHRAAARAARRPARAGVATPPPTEAR